MIRTSTAALTRSPERPAAGRPACQTRKAARHSNAAAAGRSHWKLNCWQVSYVGVWVGWDEPPSLAFKSSGAPAIACYASGSSHLHLYEMNAKNGYWVPHLVDAQLNHSGDVSCSLAFHFDRPSISYCVFGGSAAPGELRYAHRGSTLAWTTGLVCPAQWSGSSLAFAPNRHPSIAFYNADPVAPDTARRAAIFRSGLAPLRIPKGLEGMFPSPLCQPGTPRSLIEA
jgi:hypothetical protein